MYSLSFPAGEDSSDAQTLAANPDVASVTADLSRDTATAPNDLRYADQWSLPQIGWDNVFGTINPGSSATVAVLDTGVDASQPDLQSVVVPGTDIVNGSGDGTADPNGHGTEMAGIVAAATDNNAGIAGVGYSGVNVMPVTVLGADGTGLDSDVINGVVWATQHGADVILMSFSNPGYSSALQTAVNYAWSHGVVLVAAAGNDGSSTINFPAGDKGVMGVGSTGIGDLPSMFSNTGPDVFLAAPGEGILSTDTSGGYSSISGTSASAAEVAGAAALLKANSPMASNGVIVNRLAESADAAGTSDQTGNGRLNLDRAINDTSAASIEPAGAPPVGVGGPFVGPYAIAAASSGAGTMTVSPTSANNNSAGNTLTFTFTSPGGNAGDFASGSQLSLDIPTGWTAPQNSNSGNPGFVSVTAGTCAASLASITGSTILVNQTCQRTNSFTISYANAQASRAQGSNVFLTKTKAGSGGTLTAIQNSPSVAVNCGSNKICIDGNLADWNALTSVPSYLDFTGDNSGNSTDIKAIRLTAGDGNIYIRWDVTLQQNKNKIASDGYSLTLDANHDGTSDAQAWVTFDSSGNPTAQVTLGGGTPFNVGSAQQTCNVSTCTQGGPASIEAAFPVAAFNPTGSLVGVQAGSTASASVPSSTKDCVPGNGSPAACNGFFNLDTDTGTVTVGAGHVTNTGLACTPTLLNLGQTTSCTVTVTDTGQDDTGATVTKANPTGTVLFSGSGGGGTFSAASCTLTAQSTDKGTCTFTYTPTSLDSGLTGTHTLTANYLGDTFPTQFKTSSNTSALTIDHAAPSSSVTFPANSATLTSAQYLAGCSTPASNDICGTALDTGAANLLKVEVAIQRSIDSKWWNGTTFVTSLIPIWNAGAGTTGWSYPFTPAEGTYTVQSRATDNVGNVETPGAGNTFTIANAQATSITLVSGTGTYGGTATLTATLTSGGNPVPSKTISFSLNGTAVCGGATVVTCPTTNGSGFATLTGVSLSGINAGTYASAVGASFAGDSSYLSSGGTGSLTITAKAIEVTADSGQTKVYGANDPASFTYHISVGSLVGTDHFTGVLSRVSGEDVGSYAITKNTLAIADGNSGNNYTLSYVSKDFSITKKTVGVIAENNNVQYSDPTPALGWHFNTSDFVSPDTAASVVNVTTPVTCSASGRDRLDSPAGTYTIGCDVSGLSATNYSFTVTPGTLTVTNENAFIEYSGDSFVNTASATTNTATINATAVIREAGAAGAPAVSPTDTSLGNKLSTTQLKFSVYTFSGTTPLYTCQKPVAAGSTAGTGNTVATPCAFSLSAGDPYMIKIELLVNGYYVAAEEAAAVTVSLPGTGFTTGGGWINEPNLGTRSNFGFNAKRQKNGSVQGNSLYIYRKTVAANTVPLSTGGYLPAGDYNWQIKSNSWSGGGMSLNAGCNTSTNPFTNCTGTFSGKANIQAMSRTTGAAYSLGGNYNYRVDVTDNGEPGSKAAAVADTYGIKVWSDTNGTYYQLYTGTPPTSSQFPQLNLNGGNIQVRP
ncbi:MAG: S8 family serine peptidase [Gaiellaceae bacterium]